ncbi:MAG: MFS transporter [Deltaproteobacteria bacterium]|nr:MFS transporter [Deltaproteobacteria bacterium]
MRKENLTVLIVICLGTFFHIQSIGSINVSLSAIQKDFGASLAAVQWIGLMGAIMLCSLSLCFGRAGDLIGRKTVFKLGLTLYTLGAGLAAFSGSFTRLLVFRCVMALGLTMAAPLAGAIIASVYPHEIRGQALGLLASSVALGRTTGPTIGGFILQLWGWRGVFLANFLFGIPTCLTLFWVLRSGEERRKGSFDFLGAVFLIIGFPSVLIALSLGARSDWESPGIVLWFALAAAGLASFVWREFRARAPLMNLVYLKNRSLATALLSLVLATIVFYPISIFGALYMQNVIQASPLSVGLAMATLPLCTTLLSLLSGRMADRLNPKWIATLGLFFILLGLFFYARLGVGSTMGWSVLVLSLLGAGIGLFMPANEKLAFSTVPNQDYGMLSAMLTSFGTGSGALGTAVAVALAAAARKEAVIEGPAGFAHAQQFAFSSLLPLAALAVLVRLMVRSKRASRDI